MTTPAPHAPHVSGSMRAIHHQGGTRSDLAKLALGAIGVVYGDIGTSPLYALKECVTAPHGVSPTPENVLGLLSLFFWSLVFVVVVKYLVFVLRADNNGEGGELALMALVAPQEKDKLARKRRNVVYVWMGLFGASLLYGDGMITPAISVLSAVEGLEVATHAFSPVVVPLTLVILVALFAVQKRGTSGIGVVFGPAMVLWFVTIAITGTVSLVHKPQVLAAINPLHAASFFARNGTHGFLVLGSVVLCITGTEALYADMGHFGRRAIRIAWYGLAFPALLLNYFGQGALLLQNPEAARNPFYGLAEGPWLYPMVIVSTMATVIASQALISGAFSITRQAIQLGYAPRLTIVHTSGKQEGQIYLPEVNWLLMVMCVALVLAFKESSALAAAYGMAVTCSMIITSVLFFVATRKIWKWHIAASVSLLVLFLVFDLSFFAANAHKVADGGWFPLLVALGGFAVLTTWKRGRTMLAERVHATQLPIEVFLLDLEVTKPHRVPGTAVFMSSTARGTPTVLLHHFKHNKVLHEQVLILNITTDDVPEVPSRERIRFRHFGHGFYGVTAHYGFMQTPSVREILRLCAKAGIKVKEEDTSFFLGRETLVPAPPGKGMRAWRRRLFAFLARNARNATDFFGIPPNRVVELGIQIEI